MLACVVAAMVIFLLCVVAYMVIAAIVGGYIHAFKYKKDPFTRWGKDDSAFVGIGWPLSLVWYGFLKPIVYLTIHTAERQMAWQQARKTARETQAREQRLRIAEGEREVEQALTDDSSWDQRHTEHVKNMYGSAD